MADTCGDCKYYGDDRKCPNTNYEDTHKSCRDFKRA